MFVVLCGEDGHISDLLPAGNLGPAAQGHDTTPVSADLQPPSCQADPEEDKYEDTHGGLQKHWLSSGVKEGLRTIGRSGGLHSEVILQSLDIISEHSVRTVSLSKINALINIVPFWPLDGLDKVSQSQCSFSLNSSWSEKLFGWGKLAFIGSAV